LRGTYGTGLAPVARLGAVGRAVTPRHFAWQALGLATSTFTLHGRRALPDIHLHFAWQAWHLATSTLVLHGRQVWRFTTSTFTVGGRCGTYYGTGLAPVAHFGRRLGAVTPRHFAWQAWHLATSTFTLRGRRALPDIHLRFAWQA